MSMLALAALAACKNSDTYQSNPYEHAPYYDAEWNPDDLMSAFRRQGAVEQVAQETSEDAWWDYDYTWGDTYHYEYQDDIYNTFDTNHVNLSDGNLRLLRGEFGDFYSYAMAEDYDSYGYWQYTDEYESWASDMYFEFETKQEGYFCTALIERSAWLYDAGTDWRFTYQEGSSSAGDSYGYDCWNVLHPADAIESINDILND